MQHITHDEHFRLAMKVGHENRCLTAHLHVDIANQDDVQQGAVVVVRVTPLQQCGLCAGIQVPEIHLLQKKQQFG